MAKDNEFPYPVKRPQKANLAQTAAMTVGAALTLPVWIPPLLVGVSLEVHNWKSMFFCFLMIPSFIIGMTTTNGDEKRYYPRFLNWFPDKTAEHPSKYDETEKRRLHSYWTVKESIARLDGVVERLRSQRNGIKNSYDLEQHARAALASGDEQLANSLMTSAVAAEKQSAWIEDQIDQTVKQVRVLRVRADNIETRLALYHQASGAKQMLEEMSQVRRTAAEALTDLDGMSIGDSIDDQARTAAIAELQQAGFFDDAELLPSDLLDAKEIADCSAEVAERIDKIRREQLPA